MGYVELVRRLGMDLEELDECCISEGKDVGGYASSSVRRLDDLIS